MLIVGIIIVAMYVVALVHQVMLIKCTRTPQEREVDLCNQYGVNV